MAPANSQVAPPSVNDDDMFLLRFESCTLPESEWTHLAHVRVAWLYLSRHSPGTALRKVCDGILRYNTEVLNRPEKYSETVTVAFLHVVLDRMRSSESWQCFATRIDDLLDPMTPILLNYYSQALLFSDAARLQFVEPDMARLPRFNAFNLAPAYRDGRA